MESDVYANLDPDVFPNLNTDGWSIAESDAKWDGTSISARYSFCIANRVCFRHSVDATSLPDAVREQHADAECFSKSVNSADGASYTKRDTNISRVS